MNPTSEDDLTALSIAILRGITPSLAYNDIREVRLLRSGSPDVNVLNANNNNLKITYKNFTSIIVLLCSYIT